MPSRTRSSSSKRVSATKRSGRSVSRLTVMRCRPASRSAVALVGEQDAVGRQRQIADRRLRARASRDERRQVAAEQRLAAGQPDLVDAERHEDVDERARFPRSAGCPRAAARRSRPRACSTAAQVAAVGDRQPQVAQRALMLIEDHAGSFQITRNRVRSAGAKWECRCAGPRSRHPSGRARRVPQRRAAAVGREAVLAGSDSRSGR